MGADCDGPLENGSIAGCDALVWKGSQQPACLLHCLYRWWMCCFQFPNHLAPSGFVFGAFISKVSKWVEVPLTHKHISSTFREIPNSASCKKRVLPGIYCSRLHFNTHLQPRFPFHHCRAKPGAKLVNSTSRKVNMNSGWSEHQSWVIVGYKTCCIEILYSQTSWGRKEEGGSVGLNNLVRVIITSRCENDVGY